MKNHKNHTFQMGQVNLECAEDPQAEWSLGDRKFVACMYLHVYRCNAIRLPKGFIGTGMYSPEN